MSVFKGKRRGSFGPKQNQKEAGFNDTLSSMDTTYTVKPAKVVVVPNEWLVFNPIGSNEQNTHGGFKKARANLVIHNPTNKKAIFKFKTNASKTLMNANPCFGEIAPMGKLDINVNVKFVGVEELRNAKIMVASAAISPKMKYDIKTVWNTLPKASIMEHKLKCVLSNEAALCSHPSRSNQPEEAKCSTDFRNAKEATYFTRTAGTLPEGDGRAQEDGNLSAFFVDLMPTEDETEYEMKDGFMTALEDHPTHRPAGTFDTTFLIKLFFYVVLGIAFTQIFFS